MGYLFSFVVGLVSVLFIQKIWQVCWTVLWRPYVVTKSFEKQGIKGPRYQLLYGNLKEMAKLNDGARDLVLDTNSNDLIPTVQPSLHKWWSQYGEILLHWHGTESRITITDAELAKQILSNKFGFFVRPPIRPHFVILMGKGLVLVDGLDWVKQRRILNPAFSMDKLKMMTKKMADCTMSMLDGWKNQALEAMGQCVTIEMSQEFIKLTADIIAYTAFGSSYVEGKKVFNAQRELQKCCVAADSKVFIPGSQYLPTPSNFQIWKLDRQIKKTLRSIIESRLRAKASSGYGDDLLGLMIESSVTSTHTKASTSKLSMYEIMEDCKTFFFAGHETTSNLLTWTIFLLGLHQEWQEKLREEVLKECGMGIPEADMLSKLKLMNMVLLEALRLYCPAIALARKPVEDMKLGNLMIPKDTTLVIPITKIHRREEYWGEDANEFNPLRFENGISKAVKHPSAFLGFSLGPRVCIGQNFAMLEAKTVLILILQKFSFSLSSEYKHVPINHLTLRPKYGMPIIVKPLPL